MSHAAALVTTVRRARITDPEAAPLLAELAYEYTSRYGASSELTRFPPEEFAPPNGVFLLLFDRDDIAVAGGAFRRHDERTAEVKRMWTRSTHRRRGLARRVLAELEREAVGYGYQAMYLTTGPRQPEARALYLATGYLPLFDVDADPETIGLLPFRKDLPPVT